MLAESTVTNSWSTGLLVGDWLLSYRFVSLIIEANLQLKVLLTMINSVSIQSLPRNFISTGQVGST